MLGCSSAVPETISRLPRSNRQMNHQAVQAPHEARGLGQWRWSRLLPFGLARAGLVAPSFGNTLEFWWISTMATSRCWQGDAWRGSRSEW